MIASESSPALTPSVRVGLVTGCWDALHAGHRHFLREARKQCDYLIVAVNDDESVRRLKGPPRPIYCLEVRMAAVRPWADAVVAFNGDLWSLRRPMIRICGWDQDCFDLWDSQVPVAIMLPRFGESSTTRNLCEMRPRNDSESW
jgi:cytidyltransferase-like protein